MDDAEPLSDAEAETVLLVLEKQLEWKPYDHPGNEWASAQNGLYSVITPGDGISSKGMWRLIYAFALRNIRTLFSPYYASYRPLHVKKGKPEYRFYKSFEAAKAACERHYATGKWE